MHVDVDALDWIYDALLNLLEITPNIKWRAMNNHVEIMNGIKTAEVMPCDACVGTRAGMGRRGSVSGWHWHTLALICPDLTQFWPSLYTQSCNLSVKCPGEVSKTTS